MLSGAALKEQLKPYIGKEYGSVHAWDPVNAPMIRQWCEALDCTFPPYLDADAAAQSIHGQQVAPASMLQVWLMPGLKYQRPPGSDPANPREIMIPLEANGYTGIIATDCVQEYYRYLRLGETITATHAVESVSDEKQTKLGPGFFISFLHKFQDEKGTPVGIAQIRILRYRPRPAASDEGKRRPAPPQPSMSADTQFFWDGLKQNKLLIQRCRACGELRHPPGPACMTCHSLEWDSIASKGTGSLFSFVVMHHPKNEAFDYPHPVGLIELDEGTRLVAPLADVDTAALEIGMRVQVMFDNVEGQNRLPKFRPLRPEQDRT